MPGKVRTDVQLYMKPKPDHPVHQIVTHDEWREERLKLLADEKAHTKQVYLTPRGAHCVGSPYLPFDSGR